MIPAIDGLTELCKAAVVELGTQFEAAWDLLVSACVRDDSAPNIESILTRIRSRLVAIGPDEMLIGLTESQLVQIEETVRMKIASIADPDEDRIPNRLPHHDFAVWVRQATRKRPIEAFTTNYDLLIERALEDLRIPVFDGFVGSSTPFFSPEVLASEEMLPGPGWVRLWKIHGSVNWSVRDHANTRSVVRGESTGQGTMIFPSDRKYDESRKQPYRALVDRLEAVLSVPNALLVTCGFSFGDQHLRASILSALQGRSQTHVISLQYGEIHPDDELVKYATSQPNLIVIGSNAAVLSGQLGDWQLASQVDDATHSFMDIVFDSDLDTESEEPTLTGRMLLGDFNRFCKFLVQMQPKESTAG